MLAEIQCDKFKENNRPRGIIAFHKGLNIILGGEHGDNSIGKTSFLYVIDFCFGGTGYIKNLNWINIIDHHEIRWKMKFNDEDFFFARETKKSCVVYKCDSSYNHTHEIKLKDYHAFLSEKYNLTPTTIGFRSLCSPWLRISNKGSASILYPLDLHQKSKTQDAILNFLSLISSNDLLAIRNEINCNTNNKTLLTKALRAKLISGVTSQKEFDRNQKEIDHCLCELNNLKANINNSIRALEDETIEQISNINQDSTLLSREKIRVLNRLNLIESNQIMDSPASQREFLELLDFFPSINIEKFENIEKFHTKMHNILSDLYSSEKSKLLIQLEEIEHRLSANHSRLSELADDQRISQSILSNYADLVVRINTLQLENDNYNKIINYSQSIKQSQQKLEESVSNCQPFITQINQEVNRLNQIVSADKNTPILKVVNSKSYSYGDASDIGTGNQNKAVFMLDLAILNLTPIPLIIHDSVYLKQVEDDSLLKLLEASAKTSKQIFVSLDKACGYSDNCAIPQIIADNSVLRLEKGKELYGKQWNKKK